jgi:hypothetical protein
MTAEQRPTEPCSRCWTPASAPTTPPRCSPGWARVLLGHPGYDGFILGATADAAKSHAARIAKVLARRLLDVEWIPQLASRSQG